MRKPRVFIGSSSESKGIVKDLERALFDSAKVLRWDRDVFRPGQFILEELAKVAAGVDFAVFVIGRDDVTHSRDQSTPSPRDNVVFEAGLFCGILGRERVFYVVDNQGTKIPSDWGGVGYLPFDASASEPHERVYHAMNALQERLDSLGSRDSTSAQEILGGRWWQFVLNSESGTVVSLLDIRPSEANSVAIEGRSWATDGRKKATYKSTSSVFDAKECQLSYYWEGEHPLDPTLMPAFGIGKIKFDRKTERAERGSGFFTTTNGDLGPTLKKSAIYLRATDDELAIIDDTDASAQAALIQVKLAKRKDLRGSP